MLSDSKLKSQIIFYFMQSRKYSIEIFKYQRVWTIKHKYNYLSKLKLN